MKLYDDSNLALKMHNYVPLKTYEKQTFFKTINFSGYFNFIIVCISFYFIYNTVFYRK